MRILQLNTTDVGGGAELMAMTLHREYRRRGHEATLAVGTRGTGAAGVVELDNEAARSAWARTWRAGSDALAPLDGSVRGIGRARRWLRQIGEPHRSWEIARGREDFAYPATAGLLDRLPCDLVHAQNLHNVAGYGFFDLRALPRLSQTLPFFLTLRDAWLLSGHCAHSFDCDRWLTGCGACPDLSTYPGVRRDATAFNWRRKRDLYAASRLYVATPSAWLMERVSRSMLAPAVAESRIIPNAVDTATFAPGDVAEARRALGLPQDGVIVMTVANNLADNPFKDVALVRAAIEALDRPLLVAAIGGDERSERWGGADVRYVPRQSHEALARWYRAADVYVHAARAETFGLVITEAMASGTPVVATAVGGIPEQVVDGETGLLAPAGDARSLAQALQALLDDAGRRAVLGAAAAERAIRCYSVDRMVDAYLGWYGDVLQGLEP